MIGELVESMCRPGPIDRLALAIAAREGFFVTEAQTKARGLKSATCGQRNANPGNVRKWHEPRGRDYPQARDYVDFVAWAFATFPGASVAELGQKALTEGWWVLRKLVGCYVDCRYTGGKLSTIREMFVVYAPSQQRERSGRLRPVRGQGTGRLGRHAPRQAHQSLKTSGHTCAWTA